MIIARWILADEYCFFMACGHFIFNHQGTKTQNLDYTSCIMIKRGRNKDADYAEVQLRTLYFVFLCPGD